MRRGAWACGLALLLAAAPGVAAADADADGRLQRFEGHLSVGYAKLGIAHAPGGSISMAAGVDYPVAPALRAGVDVGYDLLGTRNAESGSLLASVDYSAFLAVAYLHWQPEHLGPLGRVSVGPGLMNAHGDISTVGGGGAAFDSLSVSETAFALAADVTLISRRPSPVRIGLDLGVRVGYLRHEDWTIGCARVTIHY